MEVDRKGNLSEMYWLDKRFPYSSKEIPTLENLYSLTEQEINNYTTVALWDQLFAELHDHVQLPNLLLTAALDSDFKTSDFLSVQKVTDLQINDFVHLLQTLSGENIKYGSFLHRMYELVFLNSTEAPLEKLLNCFPMNGTLTILEALNISNLFSKYINTDQLCAIAVNHNESEVVRMLSSLSESKLSATVGQILKIWTAQSNATNDDLVWLVEFPIPLLKLYEVISLNPEIMVEDVRAMLLGGTSWGYIYDYFVMQITTLPPVMNTTTERVIYITVPGANITIVKEVYIGGGVGNYGSMVGIIFGSFLIMALAVTGCSFAAKRLFQTILWKNFRQKYFPAPEKCPYCTEVDCDFIKQRRREKQFKTEKARLERAKAKSDEKERKFWANRAILTPFHDRTEAHKRDGKYILRLKQQEAIRNSNARRVGPEVEFRNQPRVIMSF